MSTDLRAALDSVCCNSHRITSTTEPKPDYPSATGPPMTYERRSTHSSLKTLATPEPAPALDVSEQLLTDDEVGYALRTFGETITDIGLRELERPLNENDRAAAAFAARHVLIYVEKGRNHEHGPTSGAGTLRLDGCEGS